MRLVLVLIGLWLFFHVCTITKAFATEKTAEAYNELSWSFRNKNPNQAKEYALLAIEEAQRTNNTQELMRAYSFAGVAYRNLGYYEEALHYYSLGLELALSLDSKEQQCFSYINLANLHIYLKQPQKAEELLLKIKELVSHQNNVIIKGYYHVNLGRVYHELGAYESALSEMVKALSIRQRSNNKNGQGVCKTYMGDTYLKMGDMIQAKIHYQDALVLIDHEVDKDLVAATLNGLAVSQLATGQTALAKSTALRSLLMGKDVNSLLRMKEASQTLAEVARQEGDFQLADQYLNDVIAYADQLYTKDLEKQEERFSYRLKNKELEYEKDKLILIHQEETKRIIIYAVSGVFFMLLVISAFFHKKQITLKNKHLADIQKQNQLLEQKVSERTQEINEKNIELESLSKYKESHIQMIAHDLRNQLGIMLKASDSLYEGKHKAHIKKSAFGMLQMANNMVEIQKFEDTRVQLDIKPVSFTSLIHNAREHVQVLLDSANVKIKISVDNELRVSGDYDILQRVFINLFTNSINHSHRGGYIEITAEKLPLKKRVKIGVHDNGEGIDEELLPFIFEKYWQGKHKQKKYASPSSGIGLNFCKLALEAHQGGIQAESIPGRGTSFFFDLEFDEHSLNPKSVTQAGKSKLRLDDLDVESQEKVKALIDQLKLTPLYDITAIHELLSSIGVESENYNRWTDEIVKACYSWNEEYFNELLSNV